MQRQVPWLEIDRVSTSGYLPKAHAVQQMVPINAKPLNMLSGFVRELCFKTTQWMKLAGKTGSGNGAGER